MQAQVRVLEMIREALPGAIIVGDSTQPVYAGNLYYDHDRPGGWFNAATGFGALGYGPPAAIGAALAAPGVPVVCLVGDGGFQFTLAEIGAAVDADVPVDLRRLEQSRLPRDRGLDARAGVEPVGVSPAPPDFCRVADAYRIAGRAACVAGGPARGAHVPARWPPCLIEIDGGLRRRAAWLGARKAKRAGARSRAMTAITELPKLVTVFGGSGFVGRHVVRALAKRGYRVRVACRRPDLAGHLQPLGNVGQIQPVQANLRVRWSVDRAVEDADHVVNLVGILFEAGKQTFRRRAGFRRPRRRRSGAGAGESGLTHVSAIGADAESRSVYARTKARGEQAVLETVKDAVVFRPSIMFGPEDGFFNRFADMARYSPVLPLIGGGHTRFQPVYVGDVAEAIARSVDGKVKGGQIYELGGPEVMTFRACMEEMLEVIGRKRRLVPMPWWLAELQAAILGLLPNPLLTTRPGDAAARATMSSPTQAEGDGRTLAGLGIQPQSPAAILPTYLWRYRAGRTVHAQDAGLTGAPALAGARRLAARRAWRRRGSAARRRQLLHLGADGRLRRRRRRGHAGADGPLRAGRGADPGARRGAARLQHRPRLAPARQCPARHRRALHRRQPASARSPARSSWCSCPTRC